MSTIPASPESQVAGNPMDADVGYAVAIRIVLVFGSRAWPSPFIAATLVGKKLLNVLGRKTILGSVAASRFGVKDGERTSFLLHNPLDGLAHPVETTVRVIDKYGPEAFILSWEDVIREFDPIVLPDGSLELRARVPNRCFAP